MSSLSRLKVAQLTIRLCLFDVIFTLCYIAIGIYFVYNCISFNNTLTFIGVVWLLASLLFIANIYKIVKKVMSDDRFSLIKFNVVKQDGKFYYKEDLGIKDCEEMLNGFRKNK